MGEQVLVLLPSSTNWLQAEWQGPYTIQKQVGPVDYKINKSNKRKKLRVFLVNICCVISIHVQQLVPAIWLFKLMRWRRMTVDFPVMGMGDDGVCAVEVADTLDPGQKRFKHSWGWLN